MGDRITITIVLYNMLYILYNSTNTCDRQILSVWVYPTYSKVHSFWFMFVSLCLFLLSIHIKEHIITYFNSKPTHTHLLSSLSPRNVLHTYYNLSDNPFTSCQTCTHTHTLKDPSCSPKRCQIHLTAADSLSLQFLWFLPLQPCPVAHCSGTKEYFVKFLAWHL